MSENKMKSFQELLLSKLDTLAHVLDVSATHFEGEGDSILEYRIIEDMLPFGTQIAFTCNQPHNFVLWCEGKEMKNLSPEVKSLQEGNQLIKDTKSRLENAAFDDKKLLEERRIDLAGGLYLELSGLSYVNEFLIPNCYFHLVTAYNIMRMKGAPLGKGNYMSHLASKIKKS